MSRYYIGVFSAYLTIVTYKLIDRAIPVDSWENFAISCIFGGLILGAGWSLSERVGR